ncbi:MAG: hypothetical protein KF901_14520 [Myxococcales bacterium]|nr:hypothetical protein [Myxococcales bacterium]
MLAADGLRLVAMLAADGLRLVAMLAADGLRLAATLAGDGLRFAAMLAVAAMLAGDGLRLGAIGCYTQVVRRVALVLALSFLGLAPASVARACGDCPLDGSRQYTVTGDFVRYLRVTFNLHVSVRDGDREWTDRFSVVPMLLPEENGEEISWANVRPGDRVEAVVRETQHERTVVRLKIVRRAPAAPPAES